MCNLPEKYAIIGVWSVTMAFLHFSYQLCKILSLLSLTKNMNIKNLLRLSLIRNFIF